MVRLVRSARFAVLVAGLAFSAALSGCSSAPEASTTDAEGVGSIGLNLQVGGATLEVVNYSIVGPDDYTKSGSLEVADSTVVSAVLGGLPVGNGYTITLSGISTDEATSCTGSGAFDIVAHETSAVSVHMLCHQSATTGSVQVGGTFNVCPVVDGITASPAEVLVGGTISLTASAHDSDAAPSALSYAWTADSGSFDDATSNAPSFTCTAPGSVTVTLSVSDGDPAPSCAATATATITCTPTAADVQSIVDANCIGCHSGARPARGLDLVDIRTSVGVAASGCASKLRIAPGQPARSYLVDKLMGLAQDGACFSGRQMPLNKPPLAASDIAIISAWIDAGAM
ncbi:MAG TPA: PKD domain-containing protein [Polyangiaceae bacterium]|nr:PKD domain-containing protein [Polyangiaceae bacterium]